MRLQIPNYSQGGWVFVMLKNMPNKIDLTGKIFGRLTVVKEGERRNSRMYWICKCKCGNTKEIGACSLRSGHTKSCGCLKKEKSAEKGKNSATHRMIDTREYSTWSSMKSRCNNKKHTEYHNYGGRGIKICKRWNKFENFFEDMGNRPKNRSIDRKNNEGDYYKENCRWSTRVEQANNRRTNRFLIYEGERLNFVQWQEKLKLKTGTIGDRINAGWSTERTIETPVGGATREKECIFCGKYFNTNSSVSIYCSKKCSNKSQTEKRRQLKQGIKSIK